MVNWEFFDNQTPASAKRLVDDLRAGRPVQPTRGARLCTFKETARILAGFPDERPGAVEEGGSAGPASLVGLRLAKGETAPARVVHPRGGPHEEPQDRVHEPSPAEHLSSHDAPQDTSASDPAHPAGPTAEEGSDDRGTRGQGPEPRKLLAPVLSAFWDEDRSWTLDVYRRHEGYEGLRKALAMSPDDLIAYVKDSGLRGRGGAGFPTGMKWQFIPQGDGKPHYLVVNADESEPGTCKDIPLLFANPHSLIEGIVIALLCHQVVACLHLSAW